MGAKPLKCQTQAGELPPSRRLKEVAIRRADMACGCDARPAAQNHLAGHKLAVVFAQRPGKGLVSRIAGVSAGCPVPAVPKELLDPRALRLGWMQPPGVE